MGFGLATLFHNAPAPYHTSILRSSSRSRWSSAARWAIAVGKAIAARRRPVTVGPSEIVGMEGVVRAAGLVFVHGELWRARSAEPLEPGERVSVDGSTA